MMSELPGNCRGRECGFGAFGEELGCDTGSGSCWTAVMAEARTSSFHDEELQKATKQIKEIIDRVPADPKGRKLSFVHTEDGTILAWVNHGTPFPAGTVTFASGKEKVREALGIIVPKAAE